MTDHLDDLLLENFYDDCHAFYFFLKSNMSVSLDAYYFNLYGHRSLGDLSNDHVVFQLML